MKVREKKNYYTRVFSVNFLKKIKGFTLVEMIGVIIVMGIIAIIVTRSVSSYIVGTRKTVYEEHEVSLGHAAENLLTDCLSNNDNSCLLSVNAGKKIYLSELIEKGYIDRLQEPSSQDKSMKNIKLT